MKFYYIVGEERKIRDEIELLDPSMWSGDEPLFGAYDWYYENDEFLETELSAANELGIGDERNYWERYQTYIEEWAERHS